MLRGGRKHVAVNRKMVDVNRRLHQCAPFVRLFWGQWVKWGCFAKDWRLKPARSWRIELFRRDLTSLQGRVIVRRSWGQSPTWGGRDNKVSGKSEKIREATWADLCRRNGWVCKVCGAVPELGKRFDGDLCDDCRLQLKNE